jgi:hypothetical protein
MNAGERPLRLETDLGPAVDTTTWRLGLPIVKVSRVPVSQQSTRNQVVRCCTVAKSASGYEGNAR